MQVPVLVRLKQLYLHKINEMLKKLPLFVLMLLSGLLLTAAWPVNGFSPLLFVAWVPLLVAGNRMLQQPEKYKNKHFFFYSFITVFVWNLGVTWWVYFASFGGAAMAIVTNSIIMALILLLSRIVAKNTTVNLGLAAFVVFWLGFEYYHQYWDLTWPWLTLGNGFAANHQWIQWYEFTGFSGGSLWVLLCNVFLFKIVDSQKSVKELTKPIALLLLFIIVPITLSYIIYVNYEQKGALHQITIVQPNIDPYNEKFSGMTSEEQLQKLMQIASTQLTSNSTYLVGPETAIVDNIWENEMNEDYSIVLLDSFVKRYPKMNIVIGASTMYMYQDGEKMSPTKRKYGRSGKFYESYNTALQIDGVQKVQAYHKSRLVPGVEKMPFPAFFKLFEDFALELGGTSGSLGMQDDREVFLAKDKNTKVAPIICYESVYADYVSEYVRNGANLLFIITNDGWWDDTPGYKQHLAYAKLRAIENRRSIARSANTGVSAFINQRGDISQPTAWWQEAVITETILANTETTLFTKTGDIIGKSAQLASVLGLLALIGFKLLKFFKKQ